MAENRLILSLTAMATLMLSLVAVVVSHSEVDLSESHFVVAVAASQLTGLAAAMRVRKNHRWLIAIFAMGACIIWATIAAKATGHPAVVWLAWWAIYFVVCWLTLGAMLALGTLCYRSTQKQKIAQQQFSLATMFLLINIFALLLGASRWLANQQMANLPTLLTLAIVAIQASCCAANGMSARNLAHVVSLNAAGMVVAMALLCGLTIPATGLVLWQTVLLTIGTFAVRFIIQPSQRDAVNAPLVSIAFPESKGSLGHRYDGL